ncbi:MAG TPA: ATP-binding protein [Terriglobales bacterium]|nr:ATP-binding protein [Terriglobales bacterium]
MSVHDSSSPPGKGWKHKARSLSAKLLFSLVASMTAVFGVLGYLNIRLHREHLEQSTLLSAERVSDVIRRSTAYYMLRNDREGLYQVMNTIGDEPGMVRVRIFDKEGRISYSTDPSEVNHIVDKRAEACYACHAQSQPLVKLNRPDRFRIYRDSKGQRVLGIITPLENQPACSEGECHAHPPTQQVLGVLDTNISLAKADTQLAQSSNRMLAYTIAGMLFIGVLSWLFVWWEVGKPIQALKKGTERLAEGDLGYQLEVQSGDEVGELAHSFNGMSRQLHAANEEVVAWTRTLEDRVERNTRELKRAHEHVLHTEKMASIGKMAAVVAHEINNPLSGILTYAKLLHKWIDRGTVEGEKRQEALQCLDLIAGESRRCGDLVRNLLTFSRTSPMNPEPTDLNAVVDRCLRLVQHQLEMSAVELHRDLAGNLPPVHCDPAQIEQVLLALVMNAIDAMPHGGNLWLQTRLYGEPATRQRISAEAAAGEIELKVRDDGVGIPPEVMPQIFEPFLTTKENHGVGLGLAISRSIVERHGGQISVQSEVGRGTCFCIRLPLQALPAAAGPAPVEPEVSKAR